MYYRYVMYYRCVMSCITVMWLLAPIAPPFVLHWDWAGKETNKRTDIAKSHIRGVFVYSFIFSSLFFWGDVLKVFPCIYFILFFYEALGSVVHGPAGSPPLWALCRRLGSNRGCVQWFQVPYSNFHAVGHSLFPVDKHEQGSYFKLLNNFVLWQSSILLHPLCSLRDFLLCIAMSVQDAKKFPQHGTPWAFPLSNPAAAAWQGPLLPSFLPLQYKLRGDEQLHMEESPLLCHFFFLNHIYFLECCFPLYSGREGTGNLKQGFPSCL